MQKRLLALIGATLAAALVAGGVTLSSPAALTATQTTPFSGAYNAPACGAHTFAVASGMRVISAVAHTTVAANDIVIYLYKGDTLLQSSDTATSPESVTYSTGETLEPGDYRVEVCPFEGQAVVSPSEYTGAFTVSDAPTPPISPVPAAGDRAASFEGTLSFGPSAVVSAHFLGSEPQVEAERREAWAGSSVDPRRVFVDWPLSSRSAIGQLNRSLDGGDSFRPLIDLACAARSRPNCATGGGGDTESDINLATGRLFFSDQEVLANEAYATSPDHGDTWDKQTPLANTTTGTDRQWLAATDSTASVAGVKIGAFLEYHVVPQSYIQGITDDGILLPQPVPQLHDVGQSGQSKVDNNAASPGHGWLYQPYSAFEAGGVWVATVRSDQYVDPTAWTTHRITPDSVSSFPWVAIDRHGNAYATWDNGGHVYYSYSPIDDPRNNPKAGGTPGSYWTGRAQISLATFTSAVFPEVIAGDDGRIGVTYMATTDPVPEGSPDAAPPPTEWRVYAAVVTNAASDNPVVATGEVSHRVAHRGNICSRGTFCGIPPLGDPAVDDRSLADMIDVTFDDSGRLGVIYMDNNTLSFQNHPRNAQDSTAADLSPFVHYARQITGTSVVAATSPLRTTGERDASADPSGDATWPNRAYTSPGANLAALDLRGLSLGLGNGDIVARVALPAGTTVASMASALTAYNAACVPTCGGDRLQYVVRFASPTEVYHLSYEVLPSRATRAFGGRLDDNDGLVNPASPTSVLGAAYHTDAAIPVTGQLRDGTIELRVPAAALQLGAGQELTSVTAFALAGPSEAIELTLATPMRTIDATPPFDVPLREVADVGVTASGPATGRVGVPYAVTVKVSNAGPATAKTVTLNDALPKAAGFSSAKATQGTCVFKADRGMVTCALGDLAPGATATVTLTIKPTAKGASTTTATAFAASPADPAPANNNASSTTTVR